ncbi:MAG: hypothetical protein OQJ91_09955 [Motiliproteus sp.]|nr:hypothetical protein [Motiliproteus sp.]
MSNIIPFKPKKDLDAAANLAGFITWAKTSLSLGEGVKFGIEWDADSWVPWNIAGTRVSTLGATKSHPIVMTQPFRDFAKAVMVNRAVLQSKKIGNWGEALKGLEAGLREQTGGGDVTQINAAVCAKACHLIQQAWATNEHRVYQASCALPHIVTLLRNKRLLSTPFTWTNPIPCPKTPTLEEEEKTGSKKLPSDASLIALGEIFNAPPSMRLDVMVTSSVALLLSAPARISELAYVHHDVEFIEVDRDADDSQLYLRWYGSKGFGDKPVPVLEQMRGPCETAIRRVRALTEEGREYAQWLEEHPEKFPPHAKLPKKGLDSPLSYEEACDALLLTYNKETNPRYRLKANFLNPISRRKALSPKAREIVDELLNGLEEGTGRPVYEKGKLVRREFNDTCVLTLRKINILMREKYLPPTFPYTDKKRVIKFSQALFTLRTGMLNDDTANCQSTEKPFGVTLGCNKMRLSANLTGAQKKTQSIFERWNYPGVRVNSHAFRHYLNTAAHRTGLSDVLIAAWSGRVDIDTNPVYNHETIAEKAAGVAQYRDGTYRNEKLLDKVRTNQPILASDLAGLRKDQDRILHESSFGVCVHDFAESPCPKGGSCLTCGKQVCVKGAEQKLKNLKVELKRLVQNLQRAEAALERGDFGAQCWVDKWGKDRLKCESLIALLENPELEDGALIWTPDDGWTVTANVLARQGLLDPQEVAIAAEQQTPSLEHLMGLMGR